MRTCIFEPCKLKYTDALHVPQCEASSLAEVDDESVLRQLS